MPGYSFLFVTQEQYADAASSRNQPPRRHESSGKRLSRHCPGALPGSILSPLFGDIVPILWGYFARIIKHPLQIRSIWGGQGGAGWSCLAGLATLVAKHRHSLDMSQRQKPAWYFKLKRQRDVFVPQDQLLNQFILPIFGAHIMKDLSMRINEIKEINRSSSRPHPVVCDGRFQPPCAYCDVREAPLWGKSQYATSTPWLRRLRAAVSHTDALGRRYERSMQSDDSCRRGSSFREVWGAIVPLLLLL